MRSQQTSYLSQIAEVFSSGDVDNLFEVFAPDYVDHQRPAWMDLDGSAEFVAIVEGARSSLHNLHVVLAGEAIRYGDLEVAVVCWSGVTAEGDLIKRDTVETLRIENEQVAEHWGMEIRTSSTRPQPGQRSEGRVHETC